MFPTGAAVVVRDTAYSDDPNVDVMIVQDGGSGHDAVGTYRTMSEHELQRGRKGVVVPAG